MEANHNVCEKKGRTYDVFLQGGGGELAQSVDTNKKSYQNVNVKLLRHTFFCQHKL